MTRDERPLFDVAYQAYDDNQPHSRGIQAVIDVTWARHRETIADAVKRWTNERDQLKARVDELEAALRKVTKAAIAYSLGEIDGYEQCVATDGAKAVLDKGEKP